MMGQVFDPAPAASTTPCAPAETRALFPCARPGMMPVLADPAHSIRCCWSNRTAWCAVSVSACVVSLVLALQNVMRTHFCDLLHGGRVRAALEATDLMVCVIAGTIVLAGLLTLVDYARERLAAQVREIASRPATLALAATLIAVDAAFLVVILACAFNIVMGRTCALTG